jgi:arsenite oxidase small subunit
MSETKKEGGVCASRREFLLSGGVTAAMMMLGTTPMKAEAKVIGYPKKKVGRLSRLRTGKPITFNYPDDDSENILVKLGQAAGGGIGKKADVVAFNTLCTHMGGTVTDGGYHHKDAVIGPCPFHLSTFDLTRHGMIVAGNATQNLPQIQLEVKGDDIYAVGVMGLIYGRHNNLG